MGNVLDISNPQNNTTDGSSSTGASISLGGGKYSATPPNSSNGQVRPLQQDINGRLIVSLGTLIAGEDLVNGAQAVVDKPVASPQYTPSNYQMPSTAVVAANIKADPGTVLSLRATNVNAAARYLQIHNTTAAPTAGAVPLRTYVIPAGTATNPAILHLARDYFSSQLYCGVGITFAFSTTRATYTAATAADHELDVNYL